ncbi:MAG: hypothetical protein F6K10_10340 [Moorea sp. SIO2B7]|nr:hypothetical protein [Moorena sp. SIO2B7]
MNQSIHYQESQDSLNQVFEELLESIFADEPNYVWNPADPATEDYLTILEENFSLLDARDSEEITIRAENLFSHLNQCWESTTASVVKKSLSEQFGDFVPSSWLEDIVNQAQEIVSTNLSSMDKLVQCVQPLLLNWAEEDLLVFARPVVYAMRGSTKETESTINFVRQAPWNELSPVEQAKLSMAIAQYALVELQEENQK